MLAQLCAGAVGTDVVVKTGVSLMGVIPLEANLLLEF
jgi:hypothetical protein